MQQHRLPAAMSTFVAGNISILQSGKLLTLLTPHYEDNSITVDVATRGILTSLLSTAGQVMEWDEILTRVLLLGRTEEQKKRNSFYGKLHNTHMVEEELDHRFDKVLGEKLDRNTPERVGHLVKKLKYNAIVQNLATVEQDDYKALRTNDAMAVKINHLWEWAMGEPKRAESMRQLLEELADTIRCSEILRWYGADANYHYVPVDLAEAIAQKLLDGGIDANPQGTLNKIGALVIQTKGMENLGKLLEYMTRVAQYYEKTAAMGTLSLNYPAEYIAKYEQAWWEVDMLYRQAMRCYYDIPTSYTLKERAQRVKENLDIHYAKLSNRMNIEWTRCLKGTEGFATLTQLRQWDFYERCVKPKQKKVAVLVCDALRYEMAKEVASVLVKERHTASLHTAIATLPTETKFCKPSLLPYHTLELYGDSKAQDMRVDDRILDALSKRTEHLDNYRQGAICIPFERLDEQNNEANREMFKRPLVFIYHNQIDSGGHSNIASEIASNCATSIAQIAEKVKYILASCNVTEVIVTADHGFLFHDIPFEEKDKQRVDEANLEQKSRYYITQCADEVVGVAKYALSEVSGMSNVDGIYVAVPTGTNRFNAPSGGYMFAHGGATLQELLIPVLVCRQERTDVKEAVGVKILETRLAMNASRLRCNLLQTDILDNEHKERKVTVAIYENGTAVTPVVQIALNKTAGSLDERSVKIDLTLNKHTEAKVLQLRVYDVTDPENALIKEHVTNNTLIENDFDF